MVGKRRGLAGAYERVVRTISTLGRSFLMLAFGIIFASVYIASVSVLISRVQFIAKAIKELVGALGVPF